MITTTSAKIGGVLRRVLFGLLGVGLALVGLGLTVDTMFPDEPSFGPPSQAEKAFGVGMIVLGIALGAVGIWLVRYSLNRRAATK